MVDIMRNALGASNFLRQVAKANIFAHPISGVNLKSTLKDREKIMATERKKKQDDFDMFAAPDAGTRRRRVAAAPASRSAGGPSGPAMSGGPSGPAMSGGLKRGQAAPAKRRRRSSDDAEMQMLNS
jgi:hypothetical protein